MNYEQKYQSLLSRVILLRGLQKEYFRTRNGDILSECKRSEAELDRFINEDTKPINTQNQ